MYDAMNEAQQDLCLHSGKWKWCYGATLVVSFLLLNAEVS